jgi:hypothetical protein
LNLENSSIEWFPLLIIAASAMVMLFLARRAMRGMNQQDWILLRKARSTGADLKQPQAVTFVIFTATEATAADVAQRMRSDGYATATKQAQIQFARNRRKPGAPQDGWLVSGTRSLTIVPEALTGIRKTLNELATEYKALYLGWQLADAAAPLTTPAKPEQGTMPAEGRAPVSDRTAP